ncbi:DUF397 domain-containing protein [Nonomuraea sp. NPDC050153]|uniref:DUF397 domain-containing protein n=1 Tax=Nonomuraea sp. NPDC050153 TaxID=3364359 RepID=UPI0037AC2C40
MGDGVRVGRLCGGAPQRSGGVQVRNSRDPQGPVLDFTPGEWFDFVRGVHRQVFDLPEWHTAG